MNVDQNTSIVGSISSKQSSLGSDMHNAAYESLNLNFLYIPFTIKNCRDAVMGLRALNFRGFTVSMPFKQEVTNYIDDIDITAQKIGAVNTVLHDHNKLTGYNSDWIGATQALKEVADLKGKRVALLGAGGAARAIAYGLNICQAVVTIYNRNEEKGKSLAASFDHEFGGSISDFPKKEYDVLINATSVGFDEPDQTLVDKKALANDKIVMDVVFNRLETRLLKIAKVKHCKVIPGYRMLIHQALFQFKLFTGHEAPFSVMEKTLIQKLK